MAGELRIHRSDNSSPAGAQGYKFAVPDNATIMLVNSHGKYLGHDPQSNAIHSVAVFKWVMGDGNTFSSSPVIEFTQAIQLRNTASNLSLATKTEGNVPAVFTNSEQWRILDASGIPKRRVAYDDVVFLQHARTNLYLGANPGKTELHLTTSRDHWEKWTVKR